MLPMSNDLNTTSNIKESPFMKLLGCGIRIVILAGIVMGLAGCGSDSKKGSTEVSAPPPPKNLKHPGAAD
jgi:hypothetical protein